MSIGSGPQAIRSAGEDYAKTPGLSVEALSRFLRDIDYQPPWRARADIEADYYDSNQYDAETLQAMEQKGIPPIVVNLIAPTINLITGLEAKTRQDWVVRADDESLVDFAAAMTQKLQEAERETFADMACSEAYAHQVKVGLGWVHVRRQRMNPFGYPYVVEPVHRREIWWDWTDPTLDLRYARWLVRRKWYDFDVIRHMFPKHAKLVDHVESGWSLFEARAQIETGHPLYMDFMTERQFDWDADTWRNLERKQAMLYEVWYRVPQWTYVLTFPNGFKTEFNRNDPLHVAALRRNAAQVEYVSLLKMRLSWWLGPHRLVDIPTPFPHDEFPYVPFWGYREDRTNVPYGQIRAMRPLQDEVNARRARMLWQLSARRIIGYDDAVKDKRAVEENVARPDAAIWLDGTKRRANLGIDQMLRVEDNMGLNAQQMQAYEDAKATLQDVANVFKEQLGKAGAAESGIAISQLIEQGTTALAKINENYAFSRQRVGNQLFALLKADIGTQEMSINIVEKSTGRRRTVVLNQRKRDPETGIVYRTNDVTTTRAKVVLDNVQSSATFRQYQFKELANLVRQLPPALQGPILDMVVMASDAPYKEEIVRRIRETLGIQTTPPEAMSPEELAAYEEKLRTEEMLKALEEALMKLQVERADLENRKIDAETEKTEAETKKTEVETARLAAEPIQQPEDEASNARVPGTRNLPPTEIAA